MIDPVLCLAAMLYAEAQNQDNLAKLAVAQVPIERSIQYNKTLCEVIHDEKPVKQFAKRIPHNEDNAHWRDCYLLAEAILRYQPPNIVHHALFFTSNDIPPKTVKPLRLVRRYQDMRFWK